jgi:flavorubredoxin
LADVLEIADGIYRISTFIPEANLAFNQFLIDDEKPMLFHTGQRMLFPDTLAAVKTVIDPARLRYISWSHLEADECGALNDFLAVAPSAEPVHGEIGKMLSIDDFATRPATAMGDGDVLDLGTHKLRFLVTPQVPHAWDAILLFDETTKTLLASDLFTQSGERRATTEDDMVELTVHTHAMFPGYIPVGEHTWRVFDRLEALNPRTLACMHGPSFTGDGAGALRDLRTALARTATDAPVPAGQPASSLF